MKKTIYIRADGNSEIGLGHLVRCMALADMLKEDFVIHFVCKEVPEKITREVSGKGFLLSQIHSEKEFFSFLTGGEIVVLDHYGLDSDYQRRIREFGSTLVCIDDLHDRIFYADLVINHSPAVKPEDYVAQEYTQFSLGAEYALLRPVFLKAAAQERVIEAIDTVFICFGGADPLNITKKVLEVVKGSSDLQEIIVILGAAYSHRDSLEGITENDQRIKLLSSLSDREMLTAMRGSDLAIVPASGILFEVLAAGTHPLICCNAENQRELFKYFEDHKIVPTFDPNDFETDEFESLKEQLKNEEYSKIEEIRERIKNSSLNHLSNFKKLSEWKT